jgi:hypothetical protein
MANIKSVKMHNNFYNLAKVMYGTSDLSKLTPRQIDNLTNKVTNTDPTNSGKIKGRKYSGKTYGKLKKIF